MGLAMNLYSILERAAGRWPEKTALVHAGRAIAYRELDAAAGSLAARLVQSGVRPGDKVAIMCPRSAEFVAAFFAVLRAGAIAVTVPPELKAGEVAALAEVMLPDAFCYGAEFAARVPGGRGAEGAAIFDGGTPLCVRLAAARATPQSERDRLGALDLACIAFSSGTSARAKGILFSHRSLFERAELCRAAGLITGASSLLWLLALNRVPYQICFSIMIGAKVVIADSVDTGAVPRLIREHAVDQVYAGPLFYRLIVQDAPAPEDIQNVKYFFSLGSALPEAAAAAFRAALGREILQWYALTELSPVLGNISEEPAKRGSVGKVAPGRELKLAGDPSEAGGQAAGEVLIRGP
ncbi:MAG TPA: AMP-binding protein, partial [Candidatus Binatia bacterium]